jgi:hypothetical protein
MGIKEIQKYYIHIIWLNLMDNMKPYETGMQNNT